MVDMPRDVQLEVWFIWDRLAAYAPITLPILLVYTTQPKFLLKCYLAARKAPLNVQDHEDDEQHPDSAELRHAKAAGASLLVCCLVAFLSLIPLLSTFNSSMNASTAFLSFLTPFCVLMVCKDFSHRIFRTHEPVISRDHLGVPKIKLIKREGIRRRRAALLLTAACIITLGAIVWNSDFFLVILSVFFMSALAGDANRKSKRFLFSWVVQLLSTTLAGAVTIFAFLYSSSNGSMWRWTLPTYMQMLGWYDMKWICWLYAILFANINLRLLAFCYWMDYQNAYRRGSIHLPDNSPEDEADALIAFHEGPWVNLDINQVGVKIHAQDINSFHKPYYLTVLFTWFALNITACIVGYRFLRQNIHTPEIYGILMSLASAPSMVLVTFLVALFKRDVKFIWNYEESWQLAGETIANPEEIVGQSSTQIPEVQSPVNTGKPTEGRVMKSLMLWIQDTQVVSCLNDVFSL